MSAEPGTRVGPYEIIARLGEGGMGEVFRARDPRLNRDIAIKLLHASVASDPERLRRFSTEAQAVAALNHPNVLTIHEVGAHDGHPYLATELLDGETLRARLDAGTLPFSRAIDFARQTAAGLAAAHAKGIAHRDIKPENLFITNDGRLKILDFGLAKQRADVLHEASGSDATRVQSATSAGTVLGTVGYMSPEQVRAQPADHRSDIFSLGVVLFEMLTGRRPFVGDSAVQTMNAILTEDPPEVAASGRPLSPAVMQIVRHCLEKNPDERFQSTRDLSFALQTVSGSSASSTAALPDPVGNTTRSRWFPLAAAAIAGIVIGGTAMSLMRPAPAEVGFGDSEFTPFATDPEPEYVPSWSPDGRSLAYLKDGRVFVRSFDSEQPAPITSGRLSIQHLFWFPDSSRVGFVGRDGVYAISVAGGDPERVQEGVIAAAALSPDGKTLALFKITSEANRLTMSLWFASPAHAPPVKYEAGLSELRAITPTYLAFSPDGRLLLLFAHVPAASFWLIPMDAGRAGVPRRLFTETDWDDSVAGISWMPDGRSAVVAKKDTLWLADLERGSLTRLTAGVESAHSPSASPDGSRIAFVSDTRDFDVIEIPVAGGPATELFASSRLEYGASWISPATEAREIMFLTNKSGPAEIRTRRLADGIERVIVGAKSFPDGAHEPLTLQPSPDGSRVLFTSFDGTHNRAWIAPIAGGPPVPVLDDDGLVMAAWSPDGKDVAVLSVAGGTPTVWRVRIGSSEPPLKLAELDGIGPMIEWAPTGQWIAFGHRDSISLVSPDGKVRRQIGDTYALAVAWARDGKTLYAIRRGDPSGTARELASIDVATGKKRARRMLDPSLIPAAPSNPGLRLALNADGTKLLTSVRRDRADVWILRRH